MANQKDPEEKQAEKPVIAGPNLLTRLRNYFLAGILVTAPIGITFWLTWQFIDFIDDWVTPLVPPRWNPESYLPFSLPGLGLIIAAVFLILVGSLAAGLLGRFVMRTGERLVARVPIARSVYSWTKQVFETVLSQKASTFNEVVLIEYPCRGVWAVGFITGETIGEVQRLTDETVFNVFIPATPNPTTGFLLFIPARDIHHLDITVEDGIKLVISGGLVEPPARASEIAAAAVAASAPSAADVESDETGGGQGTRNLGFVRRLRNYFFAGILVTAPISITIWLAWGFITFVDNQVTPLIPPTWNPESYLPFSIPGLGVLVVVVGLTAIGFFAAGLIGRTLLDLGEKILDSMPVIRNIYSALKQIAQTILKEKSQAFREVALIQYPRKESWALGFVTGETETHVQEITQGKMINIFLPTTPNPTSGFLLFVPHEEVRRLSMTVEEGIKMVVSGGIVTPPDSGKHPETHKPNSQEVKTA